MKLKYLIPTFMAVVAAVFVSCSDDNDPTYLDEIRVSQSYVAIPQDGGNVTIDVTAVAEWSINSESIPEWLTVSPASGNAGNATITFSADKADANRSVELLLNCSGKVQRINVVQQAEETDPVIYTVAEAVAMIKNKQQPEAAVYVKGIVCKILEISVQYGNATYFLSDDGKYSADGVWLEVYRGKWLNGASFTKGDEFSVGDEMLVKGVLIDYQGTPETSQGTCEVISVKKSLIGIDGVELLNAEEGEGVTEFPLEGGAIKVKVNSKGNGFHVVIPEAAKKWLHIADFGPDYVTLEADANTGGDRNVTVGFTTEADGTTYSCEQSFSQKGAIVAATVAEFLDAEVGTTQYRLNGIITRLYYYKENVAGFYIADYSGETLVYKASGFTGTEAKPGDVVTVVGQRGDYRGAAQLVSGMLENVDYAVTEVTIAEFMTKEDNKNVYYKVTGTLDEIANATYGNVWLKDGDQRLYVYGCYPGWGASGDARKNCLADKNIEVGDKLTVIGVKATFNDAPQVSNGIYFSHEKANEE